MSDRLSSVEIEDVLSSIRRLVSDDLRPKVVGDAPVVADKLLLTPALRVVQNLVSEAPTAATPEAPFATVPEAPFVVVAEDGTGIEDRVATIAAAVPDEGWEPETGDAVLDVAAWPESTWETEDDTQVIAAEPPVDDAAMKMWADEAEAEVVAALQADEQVFPQGMTFDEDVLRDLVRDLIREELQGALGERITRNVRKLVRSELNRVLAVTDFE